MALAKNKNKDTLGVVVCRAVGPPPNPDLVFGLSRSGRFPRRKSVAHKGERKATLRAAAHS